MFRCFHKCLIMGMLLALSFSGVVLSATSTTSTTSWADWFNQQINESPEVVSAREKMNAALSLAESREQPLYNPELETEYEREASYNNYRIGGRQTIDWWDKRGARKQQANFSRIAEQQVFNFTVQIKKAEALQYLIDWSAASHASKLALKQEQQLDILLGLIKARQKGGDLGQIDAELAYLSLSQTLNVTAKAQVRLKKIEMHLRELLPRWTSTLSLIPDEFWMIKTSLLKNSEKAKAWVNQHPKVIAARAQAEVLQQSAALAQKETKSDPTFGLNAGKTTGDNVVALSFSIPLNIRNNFKAQARAASQDALSAEAQYRMIKRKQHFAIEASESTLLEYQERFKRWQSLMEGRGERISRLLEKQWRSGDLSTADYLVALQQRTEGLLAGIELRAQFQSSTLDWLLQTGQITVAIEQLAR